MTTIYNEIDPFAAQWTENLIAAGHLSHGRVERRSITELRAADVEGPGRRHFFSGIGIWDYALTAAGWPADWPQPWSGSCPCQPFSQAGKRTGKADARHLWPEWFRLIREQRPAAILGEQVSSPDGLAWFDAVCADLEGEGYAVGAIDTCAAGVGGPHIRQRLYFVAYSEECRRGQGWSGGSRRAATIEPDRLSPTGPVGRNHAAGVANADTAGRGEQRSARLPDERDASQRNDVDGRGEVGGVEHSEGYGRREGQGDEQERSGLAHEGFVGRTAHGGAVGKSSGEGLPPREPEELRGEGRRKEGRTAEQPGGPRRNAHPGRVGDASSARAGRDAGGSGREVRAGASEGHRDRQHATDSGLFAGATRGFWAGADWLPCRDGKARPVESGTFPLASSVAGRVGLVRTRIEGGAQIQEEHWYSRSGALKGYGNALCAEVAIAFVRAAMEVLSE